MPTWKKVVVSGSAISQLANDANYLAAGGTFSSSVDSRLDSLEGGGGTSGLSQSAHSQREALISSLSSSVDTHLDANISALSSSVDTHLDANISALSGAAHTQRVALYEINSASIAALDTDFATDAELTAISSSAHTQREALNSAQTTANNNLSSSAASALRTEYVAGDTALSSSAHTQREAIKGLATTANNSLSSSIATALRAEYVAADSTLSASVDAHLDANISALSASAHAARAGGATSASAHSQRVAMINTLSSSAHTQRDALNTAQTTANNTLSSSIATALRAEYVAADTALSGAQKTYVDAKVAGIVSSAPETLDTLDELAAALNDDPNFSASIATSIGNRVLTSTFNTYSGSAAGALRTEYVAGDAALSASAHTQREAIKGLATTANNTLSSSIATALRAEYVAGDSALSGAAHTQRDALISALSASAATANNSSAITVRNLNDQTVDFGTGEVTASRFKGDGSGLTNIDVSQNATVAATFTNQTSVATSHNFGTKNVLVQVYNSDDEQIIPATITSTNANTTTITFDTSTSGTIVIAKGGHIVSGSVNTLGGQPASYYAASGSSHDQREALVASLSASAHTARSTGATSASAHTQRIAVVNNLSSSAATALRAEYVAGDNALSSSAATALRSEYVAADTALSASQKTYIDAKVAGIVDSAPETLNTLDELAAALNDDANFSASIATSIGLKHSTAAHNTYSGSAASAFRTEYTAGDTALSSSAHTQREAIKGLATTANNTLSSSIATALRSEYVAGDNALSGAAHTQREALFAINSASIAALDTDFASDAELTALSGAAHTQREAIKGLATSANNSLSSSIATALRSEYVAADTALSSSQKTYIDAKVAGIVNSAPATLDTLDELAAALNDDPNFSASIATSIGNRLLTSTHNTYSGSAASAFRTEYTAGDTALSSSAHTQREAIKGLATTANNTLSSSIATALRSEYVAGDNALSGAAHTQRVALYEINSASIAALDTDFASDAELTSLSSSAHTQREAIKGLATTANNSLSSSIATALRAEYVAGDNSLSSSAATALRAEYVAGDNALSGAAHTARRNEIAALSASADTHLDANIAALSASAHTARGTIDSSFTIAGTAGSDTFTTGDTLTFAGTGGEIETTVTDDQVQIGIVTNPTLTGNVTITGDLIVTGDTIEQQVTNLNVEDKFILINSGSVAGDAGLVVDGAGASFGWDQSAGRWAFDFGGAVANQTSITSDAHAVAVVTSDDANYQKAGNIRVDGDDIYIYS